MFRTPIKNNKQSLSNCGMVAENCTSRSSFYTLSHIFLGGPLAALTTDCISPLQSLPAPRNEDAILDDTSGPQNEFSTTLGHRGLSYTSRQFLATRQDMTARLWGLLPCCQCSVCKPEWTST